MSRKGQVIKGSCSPGLPAPAREKGRFRCSMGLVPGSSRWLLERLRSLQASAGTCSTKQEEQQLDYELPGPHFKTLTLFEPKGICTLHHSFLVSTASCPALPFPGEPREARCSLHSSSTQAQCRSQAAAWGTPCRAPKCHFC